MKLVKYADGGTVVEREDGLQMLITDKMISVYGDVKIPPKPLTPRGPPRRKECNCGCDCHD